ncbi:hypothetical protein BGX23_006138, partial [Mortierella sp. AD031]
NSSQLSLPSEPRSKRRESSIQLLDDYPKIGARSVSQQRDDDDSASSNHDTIPIPPRRYDSQQQQSDQSQASDNGRSVRAVSPTPSGTSSLANTLTSIQPSLSSSHSNPRSAVLAQDRNFTNKPSACLQTI